MSLAGSRFLDRQAVTFGHVKIGVPLQSEPTERRVAITPDVAKRLITSGHTVLIEKSAGVRAGHPDAGYADIGVQIADDRTVWACDFVATIERPRPEQLMTDTALIGLIGPFEAGQAMTDLAATGATVFAFEAVPRTSRAQVVDALSSQAAAAGYQAVLEAAAASDRFFPMLTTAAGTIRPAKVLVLGAGVAGLQAVATARRLGAVVSAFDVRSDAAEQVESIGATFIEISAPSQDSSTSGGYAKEVAADQQQLIIDGLAPHVAAADAVITTAAIPGRPAPLLISASSVKAMRPGSVIVDVAAPTGGNCEVTTPGTVTEVAGVTVIGVTDLVSRVANHASQMYAKNVESFISLVTGDDGALRLDFDDDIVSGACIGRNGTVVHPRLTKEP